MKKLDETDQARMDTLLTELDDTVSDIESAVDAFNVAQQDAYQVLQAAVIEYNEARTRALADVERAYHAHIIKIGEVNGFIQDVHSEMESYYDERSEKWKEGEDGQAYQDWMEQWSYEADEPPTPEVEELEVEEPEEMTYEAVTADDLDLPTEI